MIRLYITTICQTTFSTESRHRLLGLLLQVGRPDWTQVRDFTSLLQVLQISFDPERLEGRKSTDRKGGVGVHKRHDLDSQARWHFPMGGSPQNHPFPGEQRSIELPPPLPPNNHFSLRGHGPCFDSRTPLSVSVSPLAGEASRSDISLSTSGAWLVCGPGESRRCGCAATGAERRRRPRSTWTRSAASAPSSPCALPSLCLSWASSSPEPDGGALVVLRIRLAETGTFETT